MLVRNIIKNDKYRDDSKHQNTRNIYSFFAKIFDALHVILFQFLMSFNNQHFLAAKSKVLEDV